MCYFIGQISQGKGFNANSMVRQHNCISEALKIKLTLLNIFSRHILGIIKYMTLLKALQWLSGGLYSRFGFCFVSYFSVACLFPWFQLVSVLSDYTFVVTCETGHPFRCFRLRHWDGLQYLCDHT